MRGVPDSKQVKEIKNAIVDGYKRGVCDKDGHTISDLGKRMRQKSRYCGTRTTDKYRANYVRIFGHD